MKCLLPNSKPLTECWLIDQTTPNKGECHLTNDNDNGTICLKALIKSCCIDPSGVLIMQYMMCHAMCITIMMQHVSIL